MALEEIDAPDDDGKTIEHEEQTDLAGKKLPIEAMPPSKLPVARQFEVLSRWQRADADASRKWRADATYWKGFRAGDHWTAEDRALLESQDRPVIVFNRVLTILKAVAGMEINGRHEIHFIPRNSEDTAVNEVLSAASKWMADGCDGEDEESQAFDNCCTTGMGWCENRMSYLEDAAGLYVEDAIDEREMYWDRAAKKRNVVDARRITRVRSMAYGDALRMFPGHTKTELDAVWAVDYGLDTPIKSIEEKRRRDDDNTLDMTYDDTCEVTIVQTQWWETEVYWIVADVMTNSKAELSDSQYKIFASRMATLGMEVHAARMERKVYKQAFLGGEGTMLKAAGPSPIKGQFSWQCITGEYDAVTRSWFGLVKVLRDPQMWANKWLSQILHILNSTAKGGILAETTAFDDERQAEESYAQPEAITWLADGALSGDKPKIMPKPGNGMADGYLGLLTFAISSFKDVSGINLELLGQQDQNQPGILEAMRKQAGMTVLATLFDSLRRFRKRTGRTRLYFIQNFLSDGRFVRVAGPDSLQAVRLAKEKTTGEYDVIVDDAPTSPNQKEANWQIIQPLLAVFKDQLMANPQVFAMLMEYSPLPSRIVEAIKTFVKQAQEDPKAQKEQAENRQIAVAGQLAIIAKDQATADMNKAKAGGVQATAMYDIAIAKNLLAKGDVDGLAAHLKMMELAQSAEKTSAEVAHTAAKTERERVGTRLDVADSQTKRLTAVHDVHAARVGHVIDHLSTLGGMHRDVAGARKDHAAASRDERTPIAKPEPAGTK